VAILPEGKRTNTPSLRRTFSASFLVLIFVNKASLVSLKSIGNILSFTASACLKT
tara:strand:- start:613 stop:777 length:165 start_codon:yes stop_codon:yes gene_type:complete